MSEQPSAIQLAHPYWQRQAQEAADREAEARRVVKPRQVPPRQALREAHASRIAAQAEVDPDRTSH